MANGPVRGPVVPYGPALALRSSTKPLVPSAGRKLGAAGRVVLYLVLDFALGSVSLAGLRGLDLT